MATFIPGVGDITPQVEYFRPNLELMTGFLETKQGQFNAARTELNSVYNELKNLDLTLDENKSRREEFFKSADQQLKKLANVDLSLPENISAAKRIFNPLVEDAEMVEDLMFTGKLKNIVSTGEKFKNSSIAEDRKRYNPFTSQYAALKQQEYINASASGRKLIASSNMGYASNVNLMEKATALAKEMDLNVTIDSVTGGYRVTNKNGALVLPHLQEAFTSAFSNDPEVADYYRQKSYITVQNQIQSLAPQIGYDAAVQEVGLSLQASGQLLFAQSQEEVSKVKSVLVAQQQRIENKIKSEGIVEGSKEHRDYLEVLKNIESATEAQESISTRSASVNNIASTEDLYNLAYQLDLASDISNASEVLAQRDSEQTITEDKFALEQVKQNNRINLALLKAQLKAETGSSGTRDANGNVVGNPLQDIQNMTPADRGAAMTEAALSLDIAQADKALKQYAGLHEDAYVDLVTDYLSKENGGVLSSANGTGKEATVRYFEELEKLTPAEKEERVKQDLEEIVSSENYNGFMYENLLSIENSINAANNEIASVTQQAFNNLVSQYDNGNEERFELFERAFAPDGSLLSEEEFVERASAYITESLNLGLSSFLDYRKPIATGKGTAIGNKPSEALLRNEYEEIQKDLNAQFKNASVNVHSYFDPDILSNPKGEGSAYSFEVTKSYNLDPYAYYNEKFPGHNNSINAFTALGGLIDASKGSSALIYPGTMSNNNYLLQDDFEDRDENSYNSENLGTILLNQYVMDAYMSGKSSSASRPMATLDMGKGVIVGDQKYVAAQINFSPSYVENLKENGGDKFEDIESTYTMFVPQSKIGVGIFASDGTGALMSSITQGVGERTTTFPNGMGEVTYSYDKETGLIKVYGNVRTADASTGIFNIDTYVEYTDEESFEDVRKSIWNLVDNQGQQNDQVQRRIEAENGIIRETDPANLK